MQSVRPASGLAGHRCGKAAAIWVSAWVSELAMCAALATCLVLAIDWTDDPTADRGQHAAGSDAGCRSYYQMAVCPDTGEVLLTGMPMLLETQALTGARDLPGPAVPRGGATAVACSPADATRAIGYGDGSIWVCGAGGIGTCVHAAGEQGAVRELAFAPDGRRLACGTDWGRVVVLDLTGGSTGDPKRFEFLAVPDHDPIMCLAFSPDGHTVLAAGSDDGTFGLWDAQTGEPSARLGHHAELVSAAVFSPDGRHVYTASLDERIACWDLAAGRTLWEVDTARLGVVSLALSPDGRRLVCGSLSRQIEVREAATGAIDRVVIGHSRGTSCLQFLAASGRLVSAGYDGRVLVWDTTDWTPLRTL